MLLRTISPVVLLCIIQFAKAALISPPDSIFNTSRAFPASIQQVDFLNEWAWNLREDSPEVALKLAQRALRISQQNDYALGEGDAYKRLGQVYRSLGNSIGAMMAYQSALVLKREQNDQSGQATILGNIGNIFWDQKEYALARQYFREALQIDLALQEAAKAVQQYNGIGITYDKENQLDSAIFYFRRALILAPRIENPVEQKTWYARTWNNLASPFRSLGSLDSAKIYWERSRHAFAHLGSPAELADPLNNLGLLALEAGNARIAIDSFFLPALAIAHSTEDPLQIRDLCDNLSLAHQQLQQFDSALYYRNEYLALHDTLFNQEKSHDLAELETQYQVKEKDAKNQLLQSEGQRKTVIISAISIVAFLLTALAALFIYTQRKRLKTQQELSFRKQQQDAQRIVELVQTQEVRSLEALVEGQEQERSRLASELHDGLGSLLATVKLYFNQLDAVAPAQQNALKKADHILDEACQEVRRYSHDLAGLSVTQFGLLNAVRDLADSISGAGKLQVRVYAHQMEERLPLPMERTIYKVIQELLTNVIKHAQATQVTIQLSRHLEHLNIMLEDNGKGMDIQTQQNKPGLGLSSIKTRLDALSAEFTLDSNPGHGTTALIDIPLNHLHND